MVLVNVQSTHFVFKIERNKKIRFSSREHFQKLLRERERERKREREKERKREGERERVRQRQRQRQTEKETDTETEALMMTWTIFLLQSRKD